MRRDRGCSLWIYSEITISVVIYGAPCPPQQSSARLTPTQPPGQAEPSEAGGTRWGFTALFAHTAAAGCFEVLGRNTARGWCYADVGCSGPPSRGSLRVEPSRKANAWGRRTETKLGASERSPCADPGSPEVEPIVTAQGCFCHRQHLLRAVPSLWDQLHLPHPAVALPCPPAGTRTWLGVQIRGWRRGQMCGVFCI